MSLPANYQKPTKSKSYFKPEKWETRIRIMSDFISWYQDWNNQKPVNTADRQPSIDMSKPAKHFLACIIWNYAIKQFQCRQFTQNTFIDSIDKLEKDADWGDSKWYDLKILREWEDLLTKYTVTPWKQQDVDKEIKDKFSKLDYSLENLFIGEEVIRWEKEATFDENEDLPF